MKIKRIAAIMLAMLVAMLPLSTALAKDLGRVVISGPGLKTPIEITDHDLANKFGLPLLDNLDVQKTDAPANPGADFYTIDRGFRDEAGTIVGYDHVRYYPGVDGAQGTFQFMGTDGYESKYEGVWFHATEAESTLIRMLAENGVVLAAAKSAGRPDPANVGEVVQPVPEKVEPLVEPVKVEPAVEAAPLPVEPVRAAGPDMLLVVIGALVVVIAAGAGLTLARSRAKRA